PSYRSALCFRGSAPPVIYTLSLHDALPICVGLDVVEADHGVGVDAEDAFRERQPALERAGARRGDGDGVDVELLGQFGDPLVDQDRKSTRLNSSHVKISYAVFCLKKKKTQE